MKLDLRSRKTKHVNFVSDYIFDLHKELTSEARTIHKLSGKELKETVKNMQSISSRMNKYQKYLSLILF